MIHEKIVELNLLISIIDRYSTLSDGTLIADWGDTYNITKMQERANELLTEFLQPYVINSDSKE
jgi:hypothetical protein